MFRGGLVLSTIQNASLGVLCVHYFHPTADDSAFVNNKCNKQLMRTLDTFPQCVAQTIRHLDNLYFFFMCDFKGLIITRRWWWCIVCVFFFTDFVWYTKIKSSSLLFFWLKINVQFLRIWFSKSLNSHLKLEIYVLPRLEVFFLDLRENILSENSGNLLTSLQHSPHSTYRHGRFHQFQCLEQS